MSTPLAAQSGGKTGGLTGGLAFTVGGGWQVQALEFGYARVVRGGPFTVVALTGRLGEFSDQGAIYAGTRGVLFGASLSARTPMAHLADVGSETSTARVGLDLTLEGTGYLAGNTPLADVGSHWGAASFLPGLRYGDPNGSQFALLFGPTVFFGQVTVVRPFLGIRFEAPLARR
ncbi:MAG TPA: hypothetical protein VH116_00020 [Gemmatimonadales bacterium]|nr:hypothetical protein [Gemmatimonadales bacterium]